MYCDERMTVKPINKVLTVLVLMQLHFRRKLAVGMQPPVSSKNNRPRHCSSSRHIPPVAIRIVGDGMTSSDIVFEDCLRCWIDKFNRHCRIVRTNKIANTHDPPQPIMANLITVTSGIWDGIPMGTSNLGCGSTGYGEGD